MLIKFLKIFFSSLLMMHVVNAQLCQGSLGDPIVNITFGHGSNPGAPLAAATTSYQYVSSDCPGDGFYTVRTGTSGCFDNSWHNLSTDHTGDGSGYFMLINASYQPSAFYLDTVRGLCGNTTYEFAAWIANVLLPSSCNPGAIQPNLTFSIEKTDGTLLQTYNSGSILTTPSPTWKQYGFFFSTPVSVSDVVIRIFNNSQGGCGNDLALDDITFRSCGPQLTPAIIGSTSALVSLCEGNAGSYTFTCAVSGGFNNPSFQWQERVTAGNWTDIPGENTTSLTRFFPATTAGTYDYRLAVAEVGNLGSPQCRIASTALTVKVNANPVTTATNNGPLCEGNAAVLTATGGSQYAWTGPNAFTGSGSPLTLAAVQASQAGKYYVVVTNSANCIHKDSTTIIVNPVPLATTAVSNTTICIEDSVQLNAGGGISYEWIPSSGLSNAAIANPKASPPVTTDYMVVVSNQFACKDTAYTTVTVLKLPVANAGPDRVILEGQPIPLAGSIEGTGYSFSWSPTTDIDDIHVLQPIVDPVVDTKYILTAVSDFGCGISTDTMLVKVYKNIYVPNAFSPNGDGTNDTWNIPALEAYPSFEVAVYSRWGQLVFQTKNMLKPWDGTFKGKALPVGAYSYFINVGISQYIFKGTVMIVR